MEDGELGHLRLERAAPHNSFNLIARDLHGSSGFENELSKYLLD